MSCFLGWISPPYLLLHTVLPLAPSSSSSSLQLTPPLFLFITFPFSIFSSPSAMYKLLLEDDHPLQLLISSCILFFNWMSTLAFLSSFLWVDVTDVEHLISPTGHPWKKLTCIDLCWMVRGSFLCLFYWNTNLFWCVVCLKEDGFARCMRLLGWGDVLNRAFDTYTRGSDMLSRVMYVKDDCPQ